MAAWVQQVVWASAAVFLFPHEIDVPLQILSLNYPTRDFSNYCFLMAAEVRSITYTYRICILNSYSFALKLFFNTVLWYLYNKLKKKKNDFFITLLDRLSVSEKLSEKKNLIAVQKLLLGWYTFNSCRVAGGISTSSVHIYHFGNNISAFS